MFLGSFFGYIMSFLDHFGSVESRWTTVTSGAGSVGVSDSNLEIARTNAADVAYAYYNIAALDITDDWLWVFAAKCDNAAGQRIMMNVVNTSTPGTSMTQANWNNNVRVALELEVNAGVYYATPSYWDTTPTRTRWDHGAQAWQTGAQDGVRIGLDNYVYIGLENDGTNERCRFLIWGQQSTGGYTVNQGYRLFTITNWVNWSSIETPQTDMYLMLGHPMNDPTGGDDLFIEFAKLADGDKIHGWVNQTDVNGGTWSIRHIWSYDYLLWVPESKSIALNVGSGGSWDDAHVQYPCVLEVDGTYYMFYEGHDGSKKQIGVATASSPNGAWVKDGSNPILPIDAGKSENDVSRPEVILDRGESDPTKRFKMLYATHDGSPPPGYINLATAPDPTGPWTRDAGNPVLTTGSAGEFDVTVLGDPNIMFKRNGTWEVWYSGEGETGWDRGAWRSGRATGSSLDSLTKDGFGERIEWQANGAQIASATVQGSRIVSMASTTGFIKDALVILDTDTTRDNFGLARIRKVNAGVSLELYNEMDMGGTAPSVRQQDRFESIYVTDIRNINGEMYFYCTAFKPWAQDVTSYEAFCESSLLLTHSGPDPSSQTPAIEIEGSPFIAHGYNDDQRSIENFTMIKDPIVPTLSAAVSVTVTVVVVT
jgi:hypothetical protein